MSTAHTVARDLLVGAFRDASVAVAAGISTLAWSGRVLIGDRDGYIGELHRGRLPAMEIIEQPGELWRTPTVGKGTLDQSWLLRVHVGGVDQTLAEANARKILYAGLIVARALGYFTIGQDVVATFNASALGFKLEATLSTQNSMTRETYETSPDSTAPAPGAGTGADVGGIAVTINYNAASPVAILTLPGTNALDRVSVEVLTAFDGTSPTVTVGVVGDQGRYLAADESDLTAAGTIWEKDADTAGPVTVKVWLSAVGATQGSIRVQVSVTNA